MSPGQRPPYRGETGFWVFQNLHRYALYVALVYVVIVSYDALIAFSRDAEVGIGNLVLRVNTALIASYTRG